MSFRLIASKKIEKQLRKLPIKLKFRLQDLFLKLKEQPVPVDDFNVAKISGSDNTYRVRIQRIRVIYDVCWEDKRIDLLDIGQRKARTYRRI